MHRISNTGHALRAFSFFWRCGKGGKSILLSEHFFRQGGPGGQDLGGGAQAEQDRHRERHPQPVAQHVGQALRYVS